MHLTSNEETSPSLDYRFVDRYTTWLLIATFEWDITRKTPFQSGFRCL